MKKRDNYAIINNSPLGNNIYYLDVYAPNIEVLPGQFVNVTIPGVFLPRPISVADYDDEVLTLVYRVVGSGTEILSKMKVGEKLTILSGLGNGFDLDVKTKSPLVIGGGMGTAPLFYLAASLIEKGINPTILFGFKDELDYEAMIKMHAIYKIETDLKIALESNDMLVTDLIKALDEDAYDYFYACGPKPMLKAVDDIINKDGEFSLEARMACGIGQCKCCSIEANDGMKTLCKDGPVLKKGTFKW